MMEHSKKAAIGLGILGVLVTTVAIATKGKAAPPVPPPGRASLYGVITDAETGRPIAGVLVTLDGLEVSTDSGGSYAFPDLEPGSYTIQFQKAGYQTVVY